MGKVCTGSPRAKVMYMKNCRKNTLDSCDNTMIVVENGLWESYNTALYSRLGLYRSIGEVS